MLKIVVGAVILAVVMAIYVGVTYLHDKKMGKDAGCTGNCAGCSMHDSGCGSDIGTQSDK